MTSKKRNSLPSEELLEALHTKRMKRAPMLRSGKVGRATAMKYGYKPPEKPKFGRGPKY